MSIEFQLAFPCPHLVLEEVVALSGDRRSLVPKAPVASSNVVRVLANDDTYVPPGGLYSQAQVMGSVGGPFRVQKCDTTLTVTSSTETATITVPWGSSVQAEAVATLIRAQLGSVFVEVERGHLVLTDVASYGTESSIRVGGSAASSLGFANQRGARGQQVYPGWELATDASVSYGRFPKFRAPVRQNPMFKVAYVAPVERCPRCGGTFVENDYRFDLTGDPLMIQNEDLLYQAALKILLTRARSNPYHPSYGSAIMSRIGTKAIGAVTTLLTEDVQNALATMQALQSVQTKVQRVSAKERLYAVSSVRVTPSASDPTAFRIDVVVLNAGGNPVQLNIVFSVPGAVALTGSNGQSLGLETTGLTSAQAARLLG